jgi:hypothetical protein
VQGESRARDECLIGDKKVSLVVKAAAIVGSVIVVIVMMRKRSIKKMKEYKL